MSILLRSIICFGLALAPTVTWACSPAPDYSERRQEYEDQSLLRATVVFQGVIEQVQEPDDRFGAVAMVIKQTRTLWGRGAPDQFVITREYFASCARGNLPSAIQGFPHLPIVRNGLSVLVLGRPEDASAPWDFVILVDGALDSQRVLRRFEELRQPLEPDTR